MSARLSGRTGSSRASSRSRSVEPGTGGFHRTPMVVAVRCRTLNQREKTLGETRFPNREDTSYCSIVNVNKQTGVVGMIDPDNVGTFQSNLTAATTRPAATKEDSATITTTTGGGGAFAYNADREYEFDLVFDPTSTNEEVYQATVAPLVQCVKEGYNGTCFAYGMTGAGKTYTMSGNMPSGGGKGPMSPTSPISPGAPPAKGLCSLAVDDLFQRGGAQQEDYPDGGKVLTTVHASYLELYNERIRDLLVQKRRLSTAQQQQTFNATSTRSGRSNPTGPSGLESEPTFDIVEDPEKGIHVPQLSEVQVTSTEHLERLIEQGGLRRTKATTNSNAVSSRSHAILQLTVKRRFVAAPTAVAPDGDPVKDRVLTGKLSLIDLAGSERATTEIIAADGTGGDQRDLRRREGANINRSLLALGNCITVLGNISQSEGDVNKAMAGNPGKHHIPYRDSKLTRLLKESLGGNTRTVMIASITPSCLCYEETLSTLKYATRAKAITRKVQKNAVVTVTEEEPVPSDEHSTVPRVSSGAPLFSPAESVSRDAHSLSDFVAHEQRAAGGGGGDELKTMIFSLQHEVSALKAQLFVTQHTNEKLGLSRSNSALSTCSTTSFESRGSRIVAATPTNHHHPAGLVEDVELSCLSDAPEEFQKVENHHHNHHPQTVHTDPLAPWLHSSRPRENATQQRSSADRLSTLDFMSGIRQQLDAMILADAMDQTPPPKKERKRDTSQEGGEEDNQGGSAELGGTQVFSASMDALRPHIAPASQGGSNSGSSTGLSLRSIHVNAPPSAVRKPSVHVVSSAPRQEDTSHYPGSGGGGGHGMTSVGKEMLRSIAQRTGASELLQLAHLEQ